MTGGIGKRVKMRIGGASHAPAVSFELEGLPKGLRIDAEELGAFMERRAPGRDAFSTARREADAVEFTRGVAGGIADGGTIAGRIANRDMRPNDYGAERTIPRPGHADFGQWIEYGRIPTGGGSNSGRMTAGMCAAGGICLQYLKRYGIAIRARILEIGGKTDGFEQTIEAAKLAGDSVGGVIECEIRGMRAGIGGAMFDGLESEIAAAMFGIPGVKGVEFGNGFAAAKLRGSENDDCFAVVDGEVRTTTNRHGGILGGRTSGMPVVFRVAMKPTPTVFKPLESVDLAKMKNAELTMKGRHDPCIVRRAVPVVEAMAALVAADRIAESEAKPKICLTLTGSTIAEDLRQYAAERYFCDLVEIRADLLADADRARACELAKRVDRPAILTFRRKCDGGAYEGDEDARAEFFRQALGERCFAFVDFEADFRRADLNAAAKESGTRIIRSLHRFDGPVGDLAAKCEELRGETDEIPKIAFMPRTIGDVATAIRELVRFDGERIIAAMGKIGFASRVLAARLHSFLTFASSGGLGAIGHVSPHELVRDYRFRRVSEDTELFGVTGWPLKFTRSPELHNGAFTAEARDAVMIPMPAETAAEAVAFMRQTGMRGMAVTYPHKVSMMRELDGVSEAAKAIGAVNTVVARGGKLYGENTDWVGFAEALKRFAGGEVKGRKVAVIGAGGAARAVVYALRQMDADCWIFNRTKAKAEELAGIFGGMGFALADEAELSAHSDIIIQAAAAGNDPEHFDPLASHRFRGDELVYDLVYEPEVTPTMARARAAGCRVENGFSMLANQAREQRRVWSE